MVRRLGGQSAAPRFSAGFLIVRERKGGLLDIRQYLILEIENQHLPGLFVVADVIDHPVPVIILEPVFGFAEQGGDGVLADRVLLAKGGLDGEYQFLLVEFEEALQLLGLGEAVVLGGLVEILADLDGFSGKAPSHRRIAGHRGCGGPAGTGRQRRQNRHHSVYDRLLHNPVGLLNRFDPFP